MDHLITNILGIICFISGFYIGKNIKNSQHKNERIRKYYEKCSNCKYMVNKGQPGYKSHPAMYCFHPDNSTLGEVDTIQPDYYCGKFEVCDAFATELMKLPLEQGFKTRFKEPKIKSKG